MSHRTPTLKRLDMRKATGHEHPDISLRKWYLVKVDGRYHVGKFGREWYGLNFEGVYDAGLQFDAPGYNQSSWQQIWELNT